MANQHPEWEAALKAELARLWADRTVRRHELPALLGRTMNAIAHQACQSGLGKRWDVGIGRAEGGKKRWGGGSNRQKTTSARRQTGAQEPGTDRAEAERQAETIRRYYAQMGSSVKVHVVSCALPGGSVSWSARIATPVQAAINPAARRPVGINPGWAAR